MEVSDRDAGGGGAVAEADGVEGEMMLDLGQPRTDMWLVKIPHGELAEAVTNALDNEVIGTIVIKKAIDSAGASQGQRKRKPESEVKLEVDPTLAKRHAAAKADGGGLHAEYAMGNKPVKAESMLVFSETKGEGDDLGVAVEGKISKHFALTFDSMKTIQDRFSQRVRSDADKETTSEVSGPRIQHYNPRGQAQVEQRRTAGKAPTAKTTAIGVTDEEIQVRLFKRFEEFTYYSLANLAALEKLPQSAVRKVLEVIAEKQGEGEHRNKWALKAAYRQG